MKAIREMCVAGRTIMAAMRIVPDFKQTGKKRAPKSSPSKDAVRKVNEKNAVRLLTAKLNHNFRGGDLHVTLTYAGEVPTQEQAKKDKQNFLRKLKRYSDKAGTVLKRVDVTEYENHRIHHHIVISGIPAEVISEAWDKGFVKFSILEASGNYKNLAEYLIKETSKTFRDDDNPNKRRYNCSRNVVTPEIKQVRISERELYRELQPVKGYYIDFDSVNYYEHALTGMQCVEYIMISLDEEPRLKKWRRGKSVRIKRVPFSADEIAGDGLQIEMEVVD